MGAGRVRGVYGGGLDIEGRWYGLLLCSHFLGSVGGSGVGMASDILGDRKGDKIID